MRTDEDEGKERAMETIGVMKTAPWGCNGRVESGRIGKGALEVWVGPRHTLSSHFHVKDLVQGTILRHELAMVQARLKFG